VKLASELYKRITDKSIYILDEPTTGLHSHDVKKLLSVLENIVDKGATVIIIEHNLDVESSQPVFYNLPARQLLLVQVITCGMFELYWFYKQWNYIRKLSKWHKKSFFLVTLYHIFFAYEVFRAVETNKDLNGVKRAPWNAKQLAWLWYLVIPLMIVNPLRNLPFISGALSVLLVFSLTTFVLLPVQRYINEANAVLARPVSKPGFGFYVVTTLSIGLLLYLIISFYPAYFFKS